MKHYKNKKTGKTIEVVTNLAGYLEMCYRIESIHSRTDPDEFLHEWFLSRWEDHKENIEKGNYTIVETEGKKIKVTRMNLTDEWEEDSL